MKIKAVLTVLLSIFAFSGCLIAQAPLTLAPPSLSAPKSYPVIGILGGLNDVFLGRIYKESPSGFSVIELQGQITSLNCYGSSFATQVPSDGKDCEGLEGDAKISCDDGRVIVGKWKAAGCHKGVTKGVDQKGNQLTFVYGMNNDEAKLYLKPSVRQDSSRPPVPPVYQPIETRKEKGFSTGSGFFITDDGYLLTNYHVIQDASVIDVVTSKEDILKASLVKSNPANDLALLKVNYQSQPLKVGSSSIPAIADDIFTLGYPLIEIQGQAQKANFGKIKALSGLGNDIRYLQVDVPIQPGDSGGPLLNAKGEVIGIVSATLDQLLTLQQFGYIQQNVGYAVKADYAIPLLKVSIGDKWKKYQSGVAEAGLSELVKLSEPSVVLVIAR